MTIDERPGLIARISEAELATTNSIQTSRLLPPVCALPTLLRRGNSYASSARRHGFFLARAFDAGNDLVAVTSPVPVVLAGPPGGGPSGPSLTPTNPFKIVG
jgi:hypothetical protein